MEVIRLQPWFPLESWLNAPTTRDVALEHALLSAWTKLTCMMSGASPASYTPDTISWITLTVWRTMFTRHSKLHETPWKYCGIIVKSLAPSGITVLVTPCVAARACTATILALRHVNRTISPENRQRTVPTSRRLSSLVHGYRNDNR